MTSAAKWTRAAVLYRLVEAEKVIARTTDFPLRIRTTASDVPQYIRTDEDRMDILRAQHERLKLEGYFDPRTGLLVKPIPLSWGRGLPPTDSIQRAEEAFWWPVTFVADEGSRIVLMTYVGFKLRRSQGFPRVVRQRLARAGIKAPEWRAIYRRKDDALRMIADGLNGARVPMVEMERAA